MQAAFCMSAAFQIGYLSVWDSVFIYTPNYYASRTRAACYETFYVFLRNGNELDSYHGHFIRMQRIQ